ncbi:MAG: nucleotide pyrophosphohydrolase [Patescibacteria group bacterium]|nr:nucleotide pyrophosphohydrolase [Patescibacteria group bacterium]
MSKKNKADLKKMRQAVRQLSTDKGWEPFHTPKNTVMDLVREASEAMEHMLWPTNEELKQDEARKEKIALELADVLHSLLLTADSLEIDLVNSFWKKLEIVKNRTKKDY